MARSAADLDTALRSMAGPDQIKARGYRLDLPEGPQSLRGLRVAVWSDDTQCPVSAEVRGRVEAVATACRDAGATVDDGARPDFDSSHSHETYQNLLQATMAARMPEESYESLKKYVETLDPSDQSRTTTVLRAQVASFRDWRRHNEARSHLRWKWHEFFGNYDVVLMPIMPIPAFPHDHGEFSDRTITVDNEERPYFEQVFWAGLAGVSYLPATVVPTGLNDDGLPIGIQVVGPEYGDLTTIGVAGLLEREGFAFSPPPDYL
jgi:amidase